MIVKSAEVECRGPMSSSGTQQPPIRACMDVLTVMATSVPGCGWLLQVLERLISWARMSFKTAKSRSLVLKKGRVANRFRFAVESLLLVAFPSSWFLLFDHKGLIRAVSSEQLM